MKIGIILFEKIHGKTYIGSSRIRGYWLTKYWNEAEIFQQGKKYDVVIFQKTYWLEYAENFDGIKILDICDPDWLDAVPIVHMINNCDAVTASTQTLVDEIKKITDKLVVFIPDRQDLGFHNKQKVHKGIAKKVIWFGYSHNAKVLDVTISSLVKRNLQLTVLSNFRPPYNKADKNLKYDWANPEFDFNEIILRNDFVLLPPPQGPRGRFKSLNKTYTAWALGMPVAINVDELDRFLDPEERKKEAKKRLKEIREKYDIKQSVEDFKNLIDKLWKLKKKE